MEKENIIFPERFCRGTAVNKTATTTTDSRLQPRGKESGGFTLVELLVVVLIIGILAAVALPQYNKAVLKARVSEKQQMLANLEKATDLWVMENGLQNTDDIMSELDVDYLNSLTRVMDGLHCDAKGVLCIEARTGISFSLVSVSDWTHNTAHDGPPDYSLQSEWTQNKGWKRTYTSCGVDISKLGLETLGYEQQGC